MRVALIGPGAVGLVVAGALVRNPDVTLVIGGRAAFERLVVRGVEPALDAPATVLLAPAGGPVDLVLLATKAHQTTGARAWLDAWAGPATIVVVLQNGVEQGDTGARAPCAGHARRVRSSVRSPPFRPFRHCCSLFELDTGGHKVRALPLLRTSVSEL